MLVSWLAYFSTLKIEAKCSSETSVDFQRTTWRYMPEYRTLHNHRCEDLNSDKQPVVRHHSRHKLWNTVCTKTTNNAHLKWLIPMYETQTTVNESLIMPQRVPTSRVLDDKYSLENTGGPPQIRIVQRQYWTQDFQFYIVAHLLKASTVEPEKQPLPENGSETTFVSRQRPRDRQRTDIRC
jgi:hypothetical protein